MAATLASVCSVPLTSVLLLFELTKDYRILLPLMVNIKLIYIHNGFHDMIFFYICFNVQFDCLMYFLLKLQNTALIFSHFCRKLGELCFKAHNCDNLVFYKIIYQCSKTEKTCRVAFHLQIVKNIYRLASNISCSA